MLSSMKRASRRTGTYFHSGSISSRVRADHRRIPREGMWRIVLTAAELSVAWTLSASSTVGPRVPWSEASDGLAQTPRSWSSRA